MTIAMVGARPPSSMFVRHQAELGADGLTKDNAPIDHRSRWEYHYQRTLHGSPDRTTAGGGGNCRMSA